MTPSDFAQCANKGVEGKGGEGWGRERVERGGRGSVEGQHSYCANVCDSQRRQRRRQEGRGGEGRGGEGRGNMGSVQLYATLRG